MNQPLTGGKWAESVWCNWCRKHIGGPLAICPKCGCKQELDHIADAGKMVAEPVKQEPVAWWELNEDIGAWFLAYTFNPKAKTRPLIFGDVAPVSAEAIRAEALKEAEEIAKTIGGSFADEFLAAIRGLK